jgi:hypothetical protein
MSNQSTIQNKDNKHITNKGRDIFITKMPLLDKVCLSAGLTAEITGFAAMGSAGPILNKDNSFWINLGDALNKIRMTPDMLMVGGTALVVLGGVLLINGVKNATDIKLE